MNKISQLIKEKQGNLWAWDGRNPYSKHPIRVFDFEEKQKISVAMIKSAVQQIEARNKHNSEKDTNSIANVSLQKNEKLLLEPITRVLCELMRIPPVEIPKNELAEIKEMAEDFKNLENLPKPSGIACNWEILAREIAMALQGDRIDIPSLTPTEGNEPPIEYLKQKVLIPFRRRL